jgi:hypothetical protein
MKFKKRASIFLIQLIGFFLIFFYIAFNYVKHESTAIYAWDYSTWWNQVNGISDFVRRGGDVLQVCKLAYQSTGRSEYNLVAALPLVPFQFFGAASRTALIVAICLVYGGATYFCCIWMASNQYHRNAGGKKTLWIPAISFCAVTCTGLLWNPMLLGYADACCLAVALLAISIFGKATQDDRVTCICYFLSGFLLAFMPVLRRYFAYYFISLFFILLIFIVYKAFRDTKNRRSKETQFAHCLFFSFGAGIAFLLFYDFYRMSFQFDTTLYASFRKNSSIAKEWLAIAEAFGLIPILLSGLAVALLLAEPIKNAPVLLAAFASVISIALQLRVQSLDEHHLYPVVAGYLALVSSGAGRAFSRPKTMISTVFILTLGASSLMGVTSLCFLNSNYFRGLLIQKLFGAPPTSLSRGDLGEMQRLFDTVDRIVGTQQDAKVYVLASNLILSDGVVYAAQSSSPGLRFNAGRNVLASQQVDSRDGPPVNLLQASIVITSDEVQLGMDPSQQRCVTVPWTHFRDRRGIANAFEPLSDAFYLDKGVIARIFWRVRPTIQSDIDELSRDLIKSGLIK